MILTLFVFLALYYRMLWLERDGQVWHLQKKNFKLFKDIQRYRRLLGSKKTREAVTDMDIKQDQRS